MRRLTLGCLVFFVASVVLGQANGNLQIHFVDVGQGMGALLISPKGETVLFDDGVVRNCDKPASYLQQLGVTKIDYDVNSHYHADHLGCAAEVFAEFPLQKAAYDRGTSIKSDAMSTTSYAAYVTAVGTKRHTPASGEKLTLDATSPHPVTITFIAENGNGVITDNENDLSLVAMVKFDDFDAELGGDLSGMNNGRYVDIESTLVEAGHPVVHQVEVYDVHHHGSAYSSNDAWLAVL